MFSALDISWTFPYAGAGVEKKRKGSVKTGILLYSVARNALLCTDLCTPAPSLSLASHGSEFTAPKALPDPSGF